MSTEAQRLVQDLVKAVCLQEREPCSENQAAYCSAKDAVVAALAAPEPKAEAGWQWVPVEPTREMMVAAFDIPLSEVDWLTKRYRAMINAAPPQPQPEQAPVPLEWLKAVQEAYGHLWHTNNEPMAPVPLRSPEKAAYEARKCLRDLLTTAQRGEAINAVGALIGWNADAQPELAAQAQAGQAVEEIGGVPVTWWQQDGCRNRHYTPENIGAIIADLKECEQGREVPEWVYRDHRGRCGVLWRVMSALYYGIDPAAPSQPEQAAQAQNWRMRLAAIAAECSDPDTTDALDALLAETDAPSQPEAGRVGLTDCHGLDTPERVCFYEQDFYVLSNFSSFNLVWEGFTFQTSEAAYHWEKFANENDDDTRNSLAYAIYEAPSAHEAFKLAESNKGLRRKDWDDVKVGIMRDILRAKAAQHEYVSRKLLATGDRELVENSWRDDFWGWGPNRDGQNMLGKLWMEIRAELHAAKAEGER